MFVLKLFIITTILFYLSNATTDSFSTLELVHVFFRHGDRTPDKKDFYPTDPYKDFSFYPMGLGQLTNKGKTRAYNLGKLLRKRYHDFLGEVYTPDVLTASSTNYDRTKMSLLLVLAGLWPPSSMQQWNPFLPWQPIPINYQDKEHDHLIQRPNGYCQRYIEELQKVIASEEVRQFVKQNKQVFEYVEKWTEKSMEQPLDMFDVYQNLHAEESLNLTLPEWTRLVYPEPLSRIAGMQCRFENYNDKLIRLNGGQHLKMVIESGRAKIKEELVPKGRKMYLISGHENNVVNVLAGLDLFTAHVPTYGSAVMIEFRRQIATGQYGYKIFYHNQTSDQPYLLKLPGCTEFCPFEMFTAIVSRYIPGNYTAECESQSNYIIKQ